LLDALGGGEDYELLFRGIAQNALAPEERDAGWPAALPSRASGA
jgi:hypothetical protein